MNINRKKEKTFKHVFKSVYSALIRFLLDRIKRDHYDMMLTCKRNANKKSGFLTNPEPAIFVKITGPEAHFLECIIR